MTDADNAVDRPLVDVVNEAVDADDHLSDDVKYCVLAALERPTTLRGLLDGAPRRPTSPSHPPTALCKSPSRS
ncbi:hypothetical protein HQO90_20070 [Rhodococcus fascians]|nr:hypothetical protein [Rhodococcus fascians]MBY4060463.1 hypothetical protein [Rhodococcus fascians]MBY4069449.1 hypothetical protein [Rhodococcus fascians]MBY4403790.1 hypothetical protein [Rhodococcus fascians]MBY4419103.1 hypothetical protein [Rhodococcus fascians]